MAEIIAKKYELIKKVGEGGFGAVYLTRHVDLGVLYALKLITDQKSLDEEFMERFKREAQVLSRLLHKNSIPLRDFGRTEKGHFYMAMDYCNGKTLKELMEQEGAFHPLRTLNLITQILDVLNEAHKVGIIHRDLKPANIMIEQDSKGNELIKVLDFGVAKLMQDLSEINDESGSVDITKAGAIVGTPMFMSPEQANGLEIDHRSDIYAMGMVMYYMIMGKKPYIADSDIQILMLQLQQYPPPFRQARPDLQIPPYLEQLTFKAIQKDKEKRFQSAAEFLHFSRQILANLHQSAPQSSPPPPQARSSNVMTMDESSGPNQGVGSNVITPNNLPAASSGSQPQYPAPPVPTGPSGTAPNPVISGPPSTGSNPIVSGPPSSPPAGGGVGKIKKSRSALRRSQTIEPTGNKSNQTLNIVLLLLLILAPATIFIIIQSGALSSTTPEKDKTEKDKPTDVAGEEEKKKKYDRLILNTRRAMENKEYSQAVKYSRSALKLLDTLEVRKLLKKAERQEKYSTYLRKANIAYYDKNYKDTVKYAQLALDMNFKENKQLKIQLLKSKQMLRYLNMVTRAKKAYANREYKTSYDLARKILEINFQEDIHRLKKQSQGQIYLAKGKKAEGNGQLERALRLYKKAQREDPDNNEISQSLKQVKAKIARLPSRIKWEKKVQGRIYVRAVIHKRSNTVFCVTESGMVYGWDLETGREKWKTNVGAKILAAPIIFKDRLFVGDGKGILHEIHLSKKKIKHRKTGYPIRTMSKHKGLLIFSCSGGHLHSIDLRSGNPAWNVNNLKGVVYSRPRYFKDFALFTCDKGILYFVNVRAGKMMGGRPYNAPLRVTPCYHRGLMFIPVSGKLFAFNLTKQDPNPIWSQSIRTYTHNRSRKGKRDAAPVFHGPSQTVFVGSMDGRMYAINAENGKWRLDEDENHILGQGQVYSFPMVHQNTLYFGNHSGRFLAFDCNTLLEKWRVEKFGGPVEAKPILHKDILYIGGGSTFRALRINRR